MNFISVPMLEHLALIKITTILWNKDDIRTSMENLYFKTLIINDEQREWQVVEDKVIQKVTKLLLPELLKKKLLHFIKPIGLEILKWKEYHELIILKANIFVRKNLNNLCWTPYGTIDNKKTAQILIKDENLDNMKRYKLACVYCLEDDIPSLWNTIPHNRKHYFYREEDSRIIRQQNLVVLWTYYINGKFDDLNLIDRIQNRWGSDCSPYQYGFEHAAIGGNMAGTEYYFEKLTSKEKEESLVKSAGNAAKKRDSYSIREPKEHYSSVVCFILSKMTEQQHIEVFQLYANEVLKCFLDWPLQIHFMEIANRVWDFLSPMNCYWFFREMADKIIVGNKYYDFQTIFGKFWEQSPDTHKQYTINECENGLLLSKLFKAKDKENIFLILNVATLAEREKIIFNPGGKDICEKLTLSYEWDLLTFFIGECISTKTVMLKFKEEFIESITKRHSARKREREHLMWSKCFQLIDDLMKKIDKKRSIDESDKKDENDSTKRIHSAQ